MEATLCKATPLPGYLLMLQFQNGSIAVVNLAKRVQTVRFSQLADQELFATARAKGDKVIWSNGKQEVSVYCSEILDTMLMD